MPYFSWDESGWITELGHGFMLSREEDYDVWLDFNTGCLPYSKPLTASHDSCDGADACGTASPILRFEKFARSNRHARKGPQHCFV